MKNLRLPFLILSLLAFTASATQAAQLASAKVLSTTGTVTKYLADGSEAPANSGDILKQGDSIVTIALSTAELVFSNGSTLTVEENTSLTFKQLEQAAFGGNKSYEQLAGDPSKSQTLLELNYGVVDGHVKSLKSGSTFDIETPLGTAAIRGTKFSVEMRYNPVTGEFLLFITNKDGKVDVISRYGGKVEFGRGSVGDKTYDSSITNDTNEPIPPAHKIIIRISPSDPYYDDIIDYLKNLTVGDFAKAANPTGDTPGDIPGGNTGAGNSNGVHTDGPGDGKPGDDFGIIVVSPEGPDEDS